ncbi:MAG: hypothetical protein H6606_08690 [Flavobacteriales bacterium]|nr:hypothetical protein [Flavobacteriales bacterium]
MIRSRFRIHAANWVRISILFILIITVWSASNIMWGSHAGTIIKADGKGYYAHLPALFIYHDLNFGFFDEIEDRYGNEHLFYDYRKFSNGKVYNKYFAGTAFCMLPGFLIAHTITIITNGSADGYSAWYQRSVSWSAIAFAIGTLFLMVLILRKFGIRDSIIAFALPVIYFGTNWFYYVLAEPAMSHVYSIFLITAQFWFALKWAETGRVKWMILLLPILGLITWIRPLNAVSALLIPFAFPDLLHFFRALKKIFTDPGIWMAAIAAVFIVGLQLLIYKVQTGQFLIYSYEEEGFNFRDPHMLDILFSYKKGLFLYTPVLLLALLGILPMYRKVPFKAVYLGLFFLFITYLLSSWWNWYYGGSFSSRAYIEYYIIFLLPLCFGLERTASGPWFPISRTLIVLLVLFCQFQTYQYRYMVIHWDSMTREKYWEAFLNFDFLLK